MSENEIQNMMNANGEERVAGQKLQNMIKAEPYPILEYDRNPQSITVAKTDIYPQRKIKRCIITYFQDVVVKLETSYKIFEAFKLRIEGKRPEVYQLDTATESIYVLLCPLGAPQAARMMEILSALGVEKFVVCGGAGTLDDAVTGEKILLATAAVRDEGTSYHYLPPAREVSLNENVRKKVIECLQAEHQNFLEVKTWTTDASFRETPDKVEMRRKEGCAVVEMECAAYYAVAEFKHLSCAVLLYAGDVVHKAGWEYRNWHARNDMREHLFDLAVKCVLKL
ncbi:MAG: nucleoside phosphorylase [Eubacteriales bacterium]|nr:nucleoside phosphorylase [Eubacteriales bacterium]